MRRSQHRATAPGLAMVAVLLASPPAAFALDLLYDLGTSAPEGRALCSFKGSVKNPDLGAQLQVSLNASLGEGFLQIGFGFVGASGYAFSGFQPGCDIFLPTPSAFAVSVPVDAGSVGVTRKFSGLLNLHGHPESDCLSAGRASGTISVEVTGSPDAEIGGLRKLVCDTSEDNANLALLVDAPPNAIRGAPFLRSVRIENQGPGPARHVAYEAKLGKALFPQEIILSQGHCLRDSKKHRVLCDLGDLVPVPLNGSVAEITLGTIPLKQGKAKTTEVVGAGNQGKLLDRKEKVATDVAKGSGSILTVAVKCKGAAGTVTIDPNGAGGVTTCTCPDPNDTSKQEVVCIETYAQKTTVTLTPSATTGRFDKWKDACAGNPAACTLTLDPSAQNPDALATAKFK